MLSNSTPTSPGVPFIAIRRLEELDPIELVVIFSNVGLVESSIVDNVIIVDVDNIRPYGMLMRGAAGLLG